MEPGISPDQLIDPQFRISDTNDLILLGAWLRSKLVCIDPKGNEVRNLSHVRILVAVKLQLPRTMADGCGKRSCCEPATCIDYAVRRAPFAAADRPNIEHYVWRVGSFGKERLQETDDQAHLPAVRQNNVIAPGADPSQQAFESIEMQPTSFDTLQAQERTTIQDVDVDVTAHVFEEPIGLIGNYVTGAKAGRIRRAETINRPIYAKEDTKAFYLVLARAHDRSAFLGL
jgi:hypothetical protein